MRGNQIVQMRLRSATGQAAWDPIVRLTHWGIAAAVLLNGILTEGGELLHVWAGYFAFSLLLLRLIWGFVGIEEARFAAFKPNLSAAWVHLKSRLGIRPLDQPSVSRALNRHPSHNPLSALMVYALWAMLAVTIATGIAMADSPLEGVEAEEPGELDDEAEDNERLQDIHETAANLLLLLAAVHVAGVAFETRFAGTDLVRRMVGVRRPKGESK